MERSNVSMEQIGLSSRDLYHEKYIIFSLDNIFYGINILQVKEIIAHKPITPIPETQAYIKGIINLRDQVIPIIDLRVRIGKKPLEENEKTSTIIVEKQYGSNITLTGLAVDFVKSVNPIDANSIDKLSLPESNERTNYIAGIAKEKHHETILLDIDTLLDEEADFLNNINQ